MRKRQAQGLNRLSVAAIKHLATPGWHGDGGGLYLEIDANGRKRWALRLSVNGKRRDFGLGPLHKVSLADAREMAAIYRAKAYRGIDPVADKQKRFAMPGMPTFKDAAEQVHRQRAQGWSNGKHVDQWINTLEDYEISGVEGLSLHHFYRAMAWLGEELEVKPADALAPRCIKDVIEEKLFDKRRDLFSDLSAVFMDTTSLSFYGEGGETLGEHGYSKDFRPDLKQMILGLVVDSKGRPICTEMWPGNTADVKVLLPVIDRLRQRFAIGRICMVADRGMISAETIQGLEERQLDYVLGARERTDTLVRTVVLNDSAPFTPLLIERAKGQTQLFVKDVKVDGKRYIVCRNETEAEKDRKDREAIVAALQDRLKRGDKALIGNSGYRRYLRKNKEAEGKQVFEIDAGKLADEAQFDGIFVLRTNAKITPLQAVLRYRDLLQVEDLFRRGKALMRTRPVFHSSDAAIRGHVFCTFLALVMQKHLDDLAREADAVPEWRVLLRDLDRLQQTRIQHNGKDWLVRTDATPAVTALFRQAGVALPPRALQTAPPLPLSPARPDKRRRGRPRRSATSS